MALNPVVYTEKVVRSFLRYQLTAYPFADERLHQQMRELLSLDETRDSPLLKAPLRLRGEYRRPQDDTLVREVIAPYRETTTLRAGTAIGEEPVTRQARQDAPRVPVSGHLRRRRRRHLGKEGAQQQETLPIGIRRTKHLGREIVEQALVGHLAPASGRHRRDAAGRSAVMATKGRA